ncbi:uncharacterized protein LOC128554446 [Mercenaria mercenaria]|uniref:uncharacterized protein LOC128554446 n=1 Tax=Mercenaria mercenaria TaxID=6596 RepID=UPI00234F11D4|nr:uncharacterized protein LOC128554446 [Mercenaria mercenaria]
MRICTSACPGLVRPDLIRTRLLRRYMATTCQVMDMSGDELKLVADHMGHSLKIHTNIYKTQNSILERTKVAKALIAMENGELGRFRGRMLESIDIDELPTPREEEEELDFIEAEEVNGGTEDDHQDTEQEVDQQLQPKDKRLSQGINL